MYVSDRNVRQVETLLTAICGRKPNFNNKCVSTRRDQEPFKISYNIKLGKKRKLTVKGEGITVHECVRSFYGELLLLFAKHHMMYFEITKFIYINCKMALLLLPL